ncbi:MAG: DEAD/DEAH box helicase, partial [Gemmatimonadales bacterium]
YGRQVEAMPVDRAWGELLVHADPEVLPVVAVCANIDSLHRITREERDLHGVVVKGSDHLTAYNLFAEAVNQHGYVGQVYGLPRHLFEDGLEAWAERRGVLVKAIEDIALGTASIFRAMDQELPPTLPQAGRELQRRWSDLVARVMPFDLVLDERTADGQEARVSKTSVAGNWGAVAGNLRYFGDRFGTPRASIEGTTLSYDEVRAHAQWARARVVITGPRKHQHLALTRKLTYFGFDLEDGVEPIPGLVPPEHQAAAIDALVDALLGGETVHPNQGPVHRAAQQLDELWRRSGGTLAGASPAALREWARAELVGVKSWPEFLDRRLRLDPADLVDGDVRDRLLSLPNAVRVLGDAVPVEYEIEPGVGGVVRLRLREGQARRIQPRDVPTLDRPVRFAAVRGNHPPLLADSPGALRELLARAGPRQGGGRRHQSHRRRR